MSPVPWWTNNPAVNAMRDAALAELRRAVERAPTAECDPDPVLNDLWDGSGRRELAAARDHLAQARERYDDAVLRARIVGLSWAEIANLLGVTKQQLHRRYRARDPEPPNPTSPGCTP